MNFPTLCVDNFFNEPNKVRDMALSLPFYKCGSEAASIGFFGIWPGYRTEQIHKLNSIFFQKFSEKLLRLFFGPDVQCRYVIETYFQKINSKYFNGINAGWVHADDKSNVLAGVIYLNPFIDKNNGTSIFIPKDKNFVGIKKEHVECKREMYTNFKKENTQIYEKNRQENNDFFKKTIEFYNIYNRLIAYDSHWHMENGFNMPENEDRLTQVFFVKRLENVWSPIQCSKEINL